jgi:hypothetical protein
MCHVFRRLHKVLLPPGWVWATEWALDKTRGDDDGWEYAVNFDRWWHRSYGACMRWAWGSPPVQVFPRCVTSCMLRATPILVTPALSDAASAPPTPPLLPHLGPSPRFLVAPAEVGDCVRRRRWHRKRFPLEGKFESLFMLGAGAKAKAVHVKTEQARDWSAAVPLRSLGTHGMLEVGCHARAHASTCPCAFLPAHGPTHTQKQPPPLAPSFEKHPTACALRAHPPTRACTPACSGRGL